VEALVKAAKADLTHGTGKVGVIGGSSSGSHAAWVALNTIPSDGWPNWTILDRPDAVVCLSGNYDFGDRVAPGYETLDDYIAKVENYTNTIVTTEQTSVSPISKVTSDIKPMYLINTVHDPMPVHQIVALECALESAGADHDLWKAWTIPDSSDHGYAYWNSPICDLGGVCNPSIKVKNRVVAFLD
jgi:acetyl esterase/lipase